MLYIAGWGRSGTTLLDNLLGQHEGYCSVGELALLWRPAGVSSGLCGCGTLIRTCPFWSTVFDQAFGADDIPDPATIFQLEHRYLRTWNMPAIWLAGQARRPTSPVSAYASILTRLYQAISSVAGAAVVVDSSKQPSLAYLASTLPEIELSIVHVVRDPRAVAYSWSRPKPHPGRPSGWMDTYSPRYSSNRWTAWNVAIELLRPAVSGRYHLLRYEDMVLNLPSSLASITSFAGEPRPAPFLGAHGAVLRPTHSAGGNPVRFLTGRITVQPDEAWRKAISPALQRQATLPAAPLMHRYGYRIMRGRDTGRPS